MDVIMRETEIATFIKKLNKKLPFMKPVEASDIKIKFQNIGQPTKLNIMRREIEILKKLLHDASE